MFTRFRLWWRAHYSSSLKVRRAAKLERKIANGLFLQTRVSDYMRDNGIQLEPFLAGILDQATRDDIKSRYKGELRDVIREYMRDKKKSLAGSYKDKQIIIWFDASLMKYLLLGGVLHDLLSEKYTADMLCSTGGDKVAREVICPKLAEEKLSLFKPKNKIGKKK